MIHRPLGPYKIEEIGGGILIESEFLNQGPTDPENAILGNFIGVDLEGTRSLPNGESGIVAGPEASLRIGGPSSAVIGACDGPCNVISANLGYGIQAAAIGTRLSTLVTGEAAMVPQTRPGQFATIPIPSR